MPRYDFTALFEQYPVVIAQMPAVFTSHQFILRLAQQNQVLYIDALHSYRTATHRGAPAPFMRVHSILSRHLHAYPDLVELVCRDVSSANIFGQSNKCAQWRKL